MWRKVQEEEQEHELGHPRCHYHKDSRQLEDVQCLTQWVQSGILWGQRFQVWNWYSLNLLFILIRESYPCLLFFPFPLQTVLLSDNFLVRPDCMRLRTRCVYRANRLRYGICSCSSWSENRCRETRVVAWNATGNHFGFFPPNCHCSRYLILRDCRLSISIERWISRFHQVRHSQSVNPFRMILDSRTMVCVFPVAENLRKVWWLRSATVSCLQRQRRSYLGRKASTQERSLSALLRTLCEEGGSLSLSYH